MVSPGEVVAGRYQLEELVGTGGMSSVYRAHDRLLERTVALKILEHRPGDEAALERFRREARAAARLSHPSIVTVIDRGEDDGRQFIVFEYVEGDNLKTLIQRSGPVPLRRALELAVEIGSALAFAHRSGIVHRDVKPQNVLVDGDGKPKVTDFGIARSVELSGVTESGAVVGTSNYIAPEQATGREVDFHTDVYSLGIVLFELLTGDVPFRGENFVTVAMRHVHEPPPSVLDSRPEVPARVAAAVERALAKDPDDRFESMDDFVGELRASLAALGAEPDADATAIMRRPVEPPTQRAPRVEGGRRRRGAKRRWLLAAAVVPVLAAAVAVGFVLSGGGGNGDGPAGGAAIDLSGVASHDPEGDLDEHGERAADAADGDPATYWPTEDYGSNENFRALKSGVGVVLDAGRRVELSEVTVRTDTPGFGARIRVGDARGGPFRDATDEQALGRSTVFRPADAEGRYVLVWITSLPEGVARINEVSAR